jgi:pimeloyl-ACP methyl ester carboxylesterase
MARELAREEGVDLLVGLSVGSQAAAVAAAACGDSGVRRLLLISPTVDPAQRTALRFLAQWAAAGRLEDPALFREQLPEWRAAGPRSLLGVVTSALQVRLEQVLIDVSSPLTVVHAEDDAITGHGYAAGLATRFHGRLVVVPSAVHSWPYRHGPDFADLVQDVLA